MATAKIDAAKSHGQGVRVCQALLAGAAADTNIAVPGLSWRKSPKFVGAIRLEGSATYAAPVDLTSEVKAGTTDGSIQIDVAVTTGDHILLTWVQDA